jgi:hypothetical protein
MFVRMAASGGAQLVGGVLHELSLTLERRLEAADHRVEGLGQGPQLVARSLVVDPPAQVGGADLGRRLRDVAHRTEEHSRKDITADSRRERQSDHRDERPVLQAVEAVRIDAVLDLAQGVRLRLNRDDDRLGWAGPHRRIDHVAGA